MFLYAHGARLRIKTQLLVFCSSDLTSRQRKRLRLMPLIFCVSIKYLWILLYYWHSSDVPNVSQHLIYSLYSTGLFFCVPSECFPEALCAQLLGMLARLFQRRCVLSSPMIENNWLEITALSKSIPGCVCAACAVCLHPVYSRCSRWVTGHLVATVVCLPRWHQGQITHFLLRTTHTHTHTRTHTHRRTHTL